LENETASEKINGCSVFHAPENGGISLVEGAKTDGAFTAIIGEIPADAPAPPLHEHPTTDEAFYVAEGEAGFVLGDKEITAGPGTIVLVPKATRHTAWCASPDAVRGVIFITPGDVEHEFVPLDGS
jgi:mannose-6-phosphate isomerase-like protein (cupin superfamily)